MKLKRYHINIFCPDWSREAALNFSRLLQDIVLKPSYHAKNKIRSMKQKYRVATKELLKTLKISNELYLDYLFEFYADAKNTIKKACYRIPLIKEDSDLIIVVSSTGKIVTVYLNNNFTGNHNLKQELYEREDKLNG